MLLCINITVITSRTNGLTTTVHPVVAGISQRSKPSPSGEIVSTSRNTHYALAGSRSNSVEVDEREGEQQPELPRKSKICAQDVRAL
jgi:hypothetical protein